MTRIVDTRHVVDLRRNKYGAKKCEWQGRTFDSQAEMRRAQELEIMQRAGAISDLQYQVKFPLDACADANSPGAINRCWYPAKVCDYKCDFTYVENGQLVVEDVKGMRTPVYALKKRWMKAQYGIEIREVQA